MTATARDRTDWLADLAPAGATWRRRWRFGDVAVAIGERDGGVCAERLPESAHDAAGDPWSPGRRPEPLAPVLARSGSAVLYGGLPGTRRLADLVIARRGIWRDRGEARRLHRLVRRAGRSLAGVHAATVPGGRAPAVPSRVAYLHDRLLQEPHRRHARTLRSSADLRPHVAPLLRGTPLTSGDGDVVLHGSFSPGAVFVPEPGAGDAVRCTRWTGWARGDRCHDLATFLGPLHEAAAHAARARDGSAADTALLRSLSRTFLDGYAAGRGRGLDAAERARLGSRLVLDLALHLCSFLVLAGVAGEADAYVAELAGLARRADSLLDEVCAP